jgi:DNA-binding MarR family transcriptional regulator
MAHTTLFDPEHKEHITESRIIIALEKIGNKLRDSIWEVSTQYGVSPVQIQILTFLRYTREQKPSITLLAKSLLLTKATLSDSVKVLIQKGLIDKRPNPTDARSSYLLLSPMGFALANQVGNYPNGLLESIAPLPDATKGNLLESLLGLLKNMQQNDGIPEPRMCFNCRFHSNPKLGHYCLLLNQPLEKSDLRIDCNEFQEKY